MELSISDDANIEDLLQDDLNNEDKVEDEIQKLTSKWVGCANHKIALVLKVLDKDQNFAEMMSAVVHILVSIRRSSTAMHKFHNLTGQCIKLPNATR